MLLHFFLLFHIVAITLMAGGTVVDFIQTRKFWIFYARDPQQGMLVRKMSDKLPLLIIAGLILLLLSGIGMMAATHGVYGEMLWFRIKIALVLLVILNGIVIGRRLNVRLMRLLNASGSADELNRVKRNLNLFHISQLTLFFIIFFLSAFKFN